MGWSPLGVNGETTRVLDPELTGVVLLVVLLDALLVSMSGESRVGVSLTPPNSSLDEAAKRRACLGTLIGETDVHARR